MQLSGRSAHQSMSCGQSDNQAEDLPLPKLQIPPGQDDAHITKRLTELIKPLTAPRLAWTLVLDGGGIQRSFKFKNFDKTWVSPHLQAALIS